MQQLPQIIEQNGVRVLTTRQLTEWYQAEEWQIKQNFRNNKERFVLGKHYITLQGDDLKEFKSKVENIYLVGKTAKILYIWTEKGALLHAKSLNTDKAWEVYDYLVDFYFRAKEERIEEKKEIVPTETISKPFKGVKAPTGQVVDIPENEKAQELLADMKKYIVGMEALMDLYNMYLSEEDFEKVAETLYKMSNKISTTAHFLRFLKPQIVQKFL